MKTKNKKNRRSNAYKRMVLQLREKRIPYDLKYKNLHTKTEDAEEQKSADTLRKKYFIDLEERINRLGKIIERENLGSFNKI